MRLGFLTNIFEGWRARRSARAEEILSQLKISYHTFRVLLDNNQRSLSLLGTVDQMLATPGASWSELAEKAEDLLSVTYELVDGLNRLTGNRHVGLYGRHEALVNAIRLEVEKMREAQPSAPSCIPLDSITAEVRPIVGGKAATLALLRQAGFPVPDGFSITSTACGQIIMESGLDAFLRRRLRRARLESVSQQQVEADAQEMRQRILHLDIPEKIRDEIQRAYGRLCSNGHSAVSVRSSALLEDMPEHTFAGQFKSILNVTTFEDFLSALKEVIASNFSSRSTFYRVHAGLPPAEHDMAVLCQHMVDSKSAGVLFTLDPTAPESGRVLLSAVPGLGTLAVGGEAPADIYRPFRDNPESEAMESWVDVAVKTRRVVSMPGGGVRDVEVPQSETVAPLLNADEALALVRYGRRIENLVGNPQDIEWAIDWEGEINILQSRAVRFARADRRAANVAQGEVLLEGGVCASPGRRIGRVKIIHSMDDFEGQGDEDRAPDIMVLRQSIVDVARWLPAFEGVVVDFGNPADHLSCVAREYSRPMLTGTGRASQVLHDGQWVILDADRKTVFSAPEEAWVGVSFSSSRLPARKLDGSSPEHMTANRFSSLRRLVETLNLTDAYGPTFSILECKSLHDIIRYTHEMAVLAMFDAGDAVVEGADTLLRRLDEGIPFHFLVIDLGGGIVHGQRGFKISPDDVLCTPLLALWEGISTPGLRWNKPPPAQAVSGLLAKSMFDGGSGRPVGQQNYALITNDYLNLNARVDYHFALVDSVCGSNPRENYIRFRFKGGGTTSLQRERRARFIVEVLESEGFFTNRKGDLVTASLQEMRQEETHKSLTMLGRLLGFSRLLDAAMLDDDVPQRVARAFLDGDYALENLNHKPAGPQSPAQE
jgi:pyruvate, water dikinase